MSVARTDETAQRAPWAVGMQDKSDIQSGQATLGIDEALNNIPGVYVDNRYNYSLDQRLSIRGAGSRANFGIRGVKVLIDGVPQSLPDGQNELNNLELGDVSRVEVLRGSASSLYGNGSGGVIAFTTDMSAPDPLDQTLRDRERVVRHDEVAVADLRPRRLAGRIALRVANDRERIPPVQQRRRQAAERRASTTGSRRPRRFPCARSRPRCRPRSTPAP